ncbi:MAG: PepSY-associated TM helix domain-containing protein [Pseudomonadota bacterium]
MTLKRTLYLAHRWLGVGMCLLFGMWFLSGVVLMYVYFPELTPSERLQHLPDLKSSTVRESPNAMLAHHIPQSLVLTSVLGRPAWLAQTSSGAWRGLFADSGEPIDAIDAADAKVAARVFLAAAEEGGAAIERVDLIDMDQWSVSGSLHTHRPLYRVHVDDASGTVLYVSSQTGQVVRDTRRTERVWNWLGANLHWIYPLALRRHPEVWHWVVVILSLVGLISIVSGAVIGIIRLRPNRPYRGRDWTPYRGIMKWHHVLGLVCSVFLFTFMLSGMFSMNPWGMFTPPDDYSEVPTHYRGAAPSQIDLHAMERVRDQLRDDPNAREIRWQWLHGQSTPVLVRSAEEYTLIDGEHRQFVSDASVVQAAIGAIRSVHADSRLKGMERLEDYDSYYYSHAGRFRPLPILRLRFDDPGQSWFHIDARTGELIAHLTSHDRTERWWYHGLHSLDFHILLNNRPAWDLVMIFLSVLGFSMAITSIVGAWRRVAPRQRRSGNSGGNTE